MTHAAARRKAQNQPNYENLPIGGDFIRRLEVKPPYRKVCGSTIN